MDAEDHIMAAQKAALEGKRPHEILQVLLARLKPQWPGHIPRLDVEWCLMQAFDVPLRVARDIEPWKGFAENGGVTDQDIDILLEPWITHYLERNR